MTKALSRRGEVSSAFQADAQFDFNLSRELAFGNVPDECWQH